LNRIPTFGDGPVSFPDGAVELADGLFGAPGEQVPYGLEEEHQPLKALQQRVVQLARDARALLNPLFDARIEFALKLRNPQLPGGPQQCQQRRRAKA
jgi:hypothetical protein